MKLPKQIKIVEVGPRDGLQNEPQNIPSAIKIEFINLLSETGLSVIECTSFVSPKWIPQLADHSYVLQHINSLPTITYPVLVPNLQGLTNAITAGAKAVAVFTAASDTFCQKNTHCSLEESFHRCAEVLYEAKKYNLYIRGYISCVMGCPYEGEVSPLLVANIAEKLYQFGCQEISLGDTIGIGTAKQAQTLIDTVAKKVPRQYLAAHFHDTYGQALVNLYAVLEKGITIIDSAVNGLGGCPYAKGASGNVATEDVLYMLNGLGIKTGINMQALLKAGQFISQHLQKPPRSKIALITH